MKNVMLTCAGRRNYLFKFFQQALNGTGKVFAADSSPDAPALQVADQSFLVPSIDWPNYVDKLVDICQQHRVGLLIPFHDLELPKLAAERSRFSEVGTTLLISSPEAIETCSDKWASNNFLQACGLSVPKTYLSLEEALSALAEGEIAFPLIVKPRWGSTSMEIYDCEDEEELKLTHHLAKKHLNRPYLADFRGGDPENCLLIQEKLSGQEYGLDIINDLDERYVCTFVKRKLRMRAGQTDRAVTVKDERLEKIGEIIGKNLGHIGILDCDLFVTDQSCYVLDLNPRIGGGYPYSHIGGANLPAVLISWSRGEQPDPNWFQIRSDVLISRYDELTVIKN